MPTKCKLCKGNFEDSPDMLVLCEHKKGVVHLGCCIHDCSWERRPCQHAVAVYDKVDL